ncbi:carboxymuconolactone decarboxylase family protein [Cognatitamlana onchidii]|uniref:carboxymuconolactone decarboxylase family protein n=1 Tax=Cognatitamlana onchidii TaxID=2562860 RepID=UPI0010A671BA|nr:carboxymuconolactone decarboxylase family protein [Algibacter onchidii]
MSNIVQEFNDYCSKVNDKILADNNKIIKRIFNLDTNAYTEGALDIKTMELLDLVTSVVLRFYDCVKYHLKNCLKAGLKKEEVVETLSIATLVDGTIIIPHLRQAYEYWDALEANN